MNDYVEKTLKKIEKKRRKKSRRKTEEKAVHYLLGQISKGKLFSFFKKSK